ncbi:MAG: aminotransferase class I/II-fold pyridoxal phosphate-dependent enzyme, partial [Algoriella sp.]
FYLFPDVTATFGNTYKGVTINNADDLALYLLEYAQVAVVSGSAFGSNNCIRMSYAASVEELQEAMTRIKNALA